MVNMKYHFKTNRLFNNGVLVTEQKYAVLSLFSSKLNNLGKDRWYMTYNNNKFYRNNNQLQMYLKDTIRYEKPSIKIKCNGKTVKGKIRNLIFNTSCNLKNNSVKKYFLVFYINLDKSMSKTKMAQELKNICIEIKSKVFEGPQFEYGYCDNFNFKSCTIEDYLNNKKLGKPLYTRPNRCRIFDHKKGPFNMYCAGNT